MKNSKFISEYKISIVNVTPLKIVNGKDEMDILIDKNENKPLILGSSISGAIKNYLVDLGENNRVDKVFGSEIDNGKESKIYVADSIGNKLQISSRPGIRRSYEYGTSLDKGKYETSFIDINTEFEIKVKLFAKDKEELEIEKELIRKSIGGLISSNLRLGASKMNGFGSFKVNKVEIVDFNLSKKEDMKNYILDNKNFKTVNLDKFKEENNSGYIEFSFKGSILDSMIVKQNLESEDVDCENMKNSKEEDIIPGSTIKGLLREYSTKILNTLDKDISIVERIFGSSPDNKEEHTIGKLLSQDIIIKNPKYCTYNRIKVDRFTGGVTTGGKFNEKRVKGNIDIKLSLRKLDDDNDTKAAVGMIIMTLRDLGLSKLTIGSSSSVGSGRLCGREINIVDDNKKIKIDFTNELAISDKSYVDESIEAIMKIKGGK